MIEPLAGGFRAFAVAFDLGHPPLPTRLMAGLAILKHTYDLSEVEGRSEVVGARSK
jgi:hypothetical protein